MCVAGHEVSKEVLCPESVWACVSMCVCRWPYCVLGHEWGLLVTGEDSAEYWPPPAAAAPGSRYEACYPVHPQPPRCICKTQGTVINTQPVCLRLTAETLLGDLLPKKNPKPKQKNPTTYRHKTKTHAGSTQTSHRRRSIPSKHQTHIQAQQKFKTAQMRTDTFPTSLQNINSRTKINLLTDTRCVLVHKKPQVGCDGKTDMTQPQADEKSQSWDSLTMKAGLPGGLDRYVADLCCQ